MPTNEWSVTHQAHQICVTQTVNAGARLFVDSELLDTTNDVWIADTEGEATLVGSFGDFRVEVFLDPAASSLAIRVNGEFIVGDQALAAAD
jgi:hypothetical protein